MRSGICTPTCSRFGTLSRRYLAAFCLRHGCLRSCECLRKRGLCLRALRWCLDDGGYHFRYLDGGPAAVFHLLLPLIDCRVLETSSLTRSEGCYRHPKVRFRRGFQPSNAASAAVPGTAGRPQQRPGHRRLFQDLEFPSLDSRPDWSFSVGPSVWEESSDISTRVDLASNGNIGVDGVDQFNPPPAVLHDSGQKDAGWRDELSQRLETYRTRRRKFVPNEAQSQFSFDDHSRKTRPHTAAAVADPSAPVEDDFSFTIAIGRSSNKSTPEESRMVIDVSLPPNSAT